MDTVSGLFENRPTHWNKNSDLQVARKIIFARWSINDCTERRVSLIKKYTSPALTKHEERLKFLLIAGKSPQQSSSLLKIIQFENYLLLYHIFCVISKTTKPRI